MAFIGYNIVILYTESWVCSNTKLYYISLFIYKYIHFKIIVFVELLNMFSTDHTYVKHNLYNDKLTAKEKKKPPKNGVKL